MKRIINRNSKVITSLTIQSVKTAIQMLERDIEKTCKSSESQGMEIVLEEKVQEPECFELLEANNQLKVIAGDEMGFVYGLYAVSARILGVTEFWFWNDQVFSPKEYYEVTKDYHYQSSKFSIEYRGWFVNDEVLIHTWCVNRRKEEPWEMVFEALLRCGGNMVIPGTDKNSDRYAKIASRMGLWISHHHAEPLGAMMFARAYPKLKPSYAEYPDQYHELWRNAVLKQKNRKVIWNLGFRGQGDYPFWENDPRYDTDKARGSLISRIIELQYSMVKEHVPGALCCTNLYGEVLELYQKRLLEVPDDVIKIWADNGYGKMVTRRQENHNPRIPALPLKTDKGKHGLYFHVSFYDLQAANHITMLPNSPGFVAGELDTVLDFGICNYWMINCSNVKPHVYFLDFIADYWKHGRINVDEHRKIYAQKYFGTKDADAVIKCLKMYHECALKFGEHEDEHAGEQFPNYVTRILVSQYIKNQNERSENLLWATNAETLLGQIEWYENLCSKAANAYRKLVAVCEQEAACMKEPAKQLFQDSLLLQAQIYCYSYTGAIYACWSLKEGIGYGYQKAFYYAGKARQSYQNGNQVMRNREHGKWHNYYENECLTDVKQTAWVLAILMGYLRTLGDGPYYYNWQREFLYAKEDKNVVLLTNIENHLKDDELFGLMEEKWGE